MASLFKKNNPLLHRMNANDAEKTGEIFDLTRKIAEEEGSSIDFIDLMGIREHLYTQTVNTKEGKKKRRQYGTYEATVVQWSVPGLSEKQFTQIENVVAAIKKPYAIRSRVNEHGSPLRPGAYPKADGNSSTKKRGYFIGRKSWRRSHGIWVTREYKSRQEASKEMRKSGWLFGEGPHYIELRENNDIKHLTFLEYVTQISRILNGKTPLPRDKVIYKIYRELVKLDIKPKSRDQIVGLDDMLEEIKWLLWSSSINPKASEYYGTKSQSVLLAGVPGIGKTLIAEVLLGEDFDSLFIPVSANSLVESKSESNDEEASLFGELDRLQSHSGVLACLYCDDVEAAMLNPMQTHLSEQYLANSSALLNRLEGMQMNPRIKLSGSSNDPSLVDPRFLEFGRIGYVIHIPLPGKKAREKTFEVHTRGKPLKNVRFDDLVRETRGYTNRDVKEICNAAARYAMKRAAKKVAKPGEDPFDALKRVDEEVMRDTPITQEDFGRAFAYVSKYVNLKETQELDKRIKEFCNSYQGGIGFQYEL